MTFLGWTDTNASVGTIGGGGTSKPGPAEYTTPTLPDRLNLSNLLVGDLVFQEDTKERWKLDTQPPTDANNWSLDEGGGYGLDTVNFDKALSVNENTIQKALDRLDEAVSGSGGLFKITEGDATKRSTPPVPGDLPGSPTEFVPNSEIYREVAGIFKQRYRAIDTTTLELIDERLPDSTSPLSSLPPATGFVDGDFFSVLNTATTPDQLEHYQWQPGDLGTGIPTQISYDGNVDVADASLSTTSVSPVQNRILTQVFGLPDAAVDMGPFTGATLANAGNVKGHLQTLETSWESLGALVNKLGPLREGGLITGTNAAMNFGVQGGSWFAWNPLVGEITETVITAASPMLFDIVLRNNTVVSPGAITFDPMQFDNGGAATSTMAQANNAQAMRLYGKPGSNYILMPGQEEYSTLNNARARWQSEAVVLPAMLDGYRLMAVVLVEGLATATDSLESVIVSASKIGEVGNANAGNVNDLVDVSVTDAAERDAQLVHDGLTIGVRSPQEVWYILDEADGTFANAVKVNLLTSASGGITNITSQTAGAAVTVGQLNKYPNGSTADVTGVGVNDVFTIVVDPGNEVVVDGNTYRNREGTPRSKTILFYRSATGVKPIDYGVDSQLVSKSTNDPPTVGRLNHYPDAGVVHLTSLEENDTFAVLVRPGESVSVGGVSHPNPSTNSHDEPFVFTVRSGAPVRLGGNGAEVSTDWVLKATGEVPEVGRLNKYPSASTVGLTGLVDNNQFAIFIEPGHVVTVAGINYTNSGSNDEPYVFTMRGGVPVRLGGNGSVPSTDWVAKAAAESPDIGKLNKYPNGATVGLTGLVDNNQFAIFIKAGETADVGGTVYTNSGANDEPYVFTLQGGVPTRLGGNSGVGEKQWVAKATNEQPNKDFLNKYPNAAIVDTAALVDGDYFAVIVAPGETLTVTGLGLLTNPSGSANDEPFVVTKQGGALRQLGGNDALLSADWIQKSNNDTPTVDALNKYNNGETANATSLADGNHFALIVAPGDSVVVTGTGPGAGTYVNSGTNDEPYVFTVRGGQLLQLGANASAAQSAWIQKATNDPVQVGALSKYPDGATAIATGTDPGDVFEILVPQGGVVTVDGTNYTAPAGSQDVVFRFVNDGGTIKQVTDALELPFYGQISVSGAGATPKVYQGDQLDRQSQNYWSLLDEPTSQFEVPNNTSDGARWFHTFLATTDGVMTLGTGAVGTGGQSQFAYKSGQNYLMIGTRASGLFLSPVSWLGGATEVESGWIDTTDGMTVQYGKKYVVGTGHTINLPTTVGNNNESITFAPSNGDWQTIPGNFVAPGVETVGQGQGGPGEPIIAGADSVTLVAREATANFLVLTGGRADTDVKDEVNTSGLLPVATTVLVGKQISVTNDPDPNKNGTYTAVGADVGMNATAWIKGDEFVDDWIDTTDGMTVEPGKKYIVGNGHTINLPPLLGLNNQPITFAPVNGDWDSLAGQFVGDGTETVGLGQGGPLDPVIAGASAIELVAREATSNWLVVTGGDAPADLLTILNTIGDLPDPTATLSGRQFLVLNDPDPANNGHWLAAGASLGSAATVIVK